MHKSSLRCSTLWHDNVPQNLFHVSVTTETNRLVDGDFAAKAAVPERIIAEKSNGEVAAAMNVPF